MNEMQGAADDPRRGLRLRERDVCGEHGDVKGDLGWDGRNAILSFEVNAKPKKCFTIPFI
jgi:hypothetical protein